MKFKCWQCSGIFEYPATLFNTAGLFFVRCSCKKCPAIGAFILKPGGVVSEPIELVEATRGLMGKAMVGEETPSRVYGDLTEAKEGSLDCGRKLYDLVYDELSKETSVFRLREVRAMIDVPTSHDSWRTVTISFGMGRLGDC